VVLGTSAASDLDESFVLRHDEINNLHSIEVVELCFFSTTILASKDVSKRYSIVGERLA